MTGAEHGLDRQRSGRTVLYQASELGLALLGAGS
jgi:hypothetical protein